MRRIFLLAFSIFMLCSTDAFSAKRYWISNTAAYWNNTANWSSTSGGAGGSSVPGGSDTAYFDGNGTGNDTLNANINVKWINIGAGYTGVLYQGGKTITMGTTGGVFSGGTFSGGSATITSTGPITISGCAFTSTSGLLTTNSNFTLSSGSFTHHSGEVKFTASLTISGTIDFSALTFNPTATATFTVSNTITAKGTLTYGGSSQITINTGTINAEADITYSNGETSGAGGTYLLVVNGTGSQSFTGSSTAGAGRFNDIDINKSSGTVTLSNNISVYGNFTRTAGTINPGSSTVTMIVTKTITGTFSLYNAIFSGGATYTVAGGSVLTVTGTMSVTGSSPVTFAGSLEAQGDITVTNSATTGTPGSGTITISGSNNQTFTGSGTANAGKLPNITINKSGGTLTLSSVISLSGDWIYTAGTVAPGSSSVAMYGTFNVDAQGSSTSMSFNRLQISTGTRTLTGNVDCNDNFSIISGATCSAGSYTLTIGGNFLNQGTWTYGASTVVFDGTGYNKIQQTSGTINFANLVLSRPSGKSVTLFNPVKINTSMTLNIGRMKTTTTNYLEFADNATCTVTNNDSAYVHGPVRKTGNDIFTFPLGDTSLADNIAYHPLAMTAPSSTSDQFEAIYHASGQTSGSAKASTLATISTIQYWTLERKAGSSTPTVTLYWNANGDNTAFSEMRVAEWTGASWIDRGQNTTTISTATTGSVKANVALSFGATPSPLVIAYGVVDKAYAVLSKSQPASGYQTTDGKVLYFQFEDEYDDQNDSLTYRIVKLSSDRSQSMMRNSADLPLVRYGVNGYKIDLYDNSNTALASGYYMLEVTNEKNETWYLRFKI